MFNRHLKFTHAFSVAVILLLLSSSPLLPQSDSSFTFIQLSDPQFGMYPFGKDFLHERENMAKAVVAINRLRPAFVVITGDLVNRVGDEKQIRAFRESIAAIDSAIPVYLVSGNHDVGNRPSEQTLERYRQQFGPDFYAFDVRGSRFIVLNSSLIKEPSGALTSADEQYQWLRSLADTLSTAHPSIPAVVDSLITVHRFPLTIMFLHHPFFLDNINETSGYGNISTHQRKTYFDLIQRLGVTYVFAGHLHNNNTASHAGIEVVASGPVGMPLGSDPPGMRIVVVKEGWIEHRYAGLDEGLEDKD